MKLIRQTVFGPEEVEITKTCSVCEVNKGKCHRNNTNIDHNNSTST